MAAVLPLLRLYSTYLNVSSGVELLIILYIYDIFQAHLCRIISLVYFYNTRSNDYYFVHWLITLIDEAYSTNLRYSERM